MIKKLLPPGQAFRLSGQAILKNASQTIDRRMIEAIARNYSPRSSSGDAQSMDQIDDDDNLIDVQETGNIFPVQSTILKFLSEHFQSLNWNVKISNQSRTIRRSIISLKSTICDYIAPCAMFTLGALSSTRPTFTRIQFY